MSESIFCTSCGAENDADAEHCSQCGTAFRQQEQTDPALPTGGSDTAADGGELRPVYPTEAARLGTVGPIDDPGRYELLELVSRSGHARLWKARMDMTDEHLTLAVKAITRPDTADPADWTEAWQAHEDVLRTLHHPSLPNVSDYFFAPPVETDGSANTRDNVLYVVSEWVDGVPLSQWRLADRPVGDVTDMMQSVAAALESLHSQQVAGAPLIHTEIDPDHVIVTDDVAVLVGVPSAGATPSNLSLYHAPETSVAIAETENGNKYSLGAVAYFGLTGSAPSGSAEANQGGLAAVPGLERRPDVHRHVLEMLSADPSQRPEPARWASSLATMTKGIAPVTEAPPAEPPDPYTAPASPAPGGKSMWPRIAAGVGGVAALVVAGVFLFGNRGGEPDAAPTTTAAATTTVATTQPPTTTVATTAAPVAAELPDVLGSGRTAALQALSDAGFTNVSIVEQMSEVTEGTVLTMTPPAGTELFPGDEIVLTVATELLLMLPDLTGVAPEIALGQLGELGFLSIALTDKPSVLPAGTIVDSNPTWGAELPLDASIELFVGVAIETPDFSGATVDEVRQTVEGWGATLNLIQLYDPGEQDGVFISQVPEPGEPMTEEFTLEVYQGPVVTYLKDVQAVVFPTDSQFNAVFVDEAALNGGVSENALIISTTESGSDTYEAVLEFNLARSFDRLLADVYYEQNSYSRGQIRLEIEDERGFRLETARTYRLSDQEPRPLVVEVDGVLRLFIIVETLCCEGIGTVEAIVLGNIRLLGPPEGATTDG